MSEVKPLVFGATPSVPATVSSNNQLTTEQQRTVDTYKKSINFSDISTIQKYGAEATNSVSAVVETMLTNVKSGNVGEIGESLNKMVVLSNKLPLEQFASGNNSWLSKLLPFLKLTKSKFMGQFTTISGQIESVSKTLATLNSQHAKSITTLQTLIQDCEAKYFKLDLLIIAGREKLAEELASIEEETRQISLLSTPDPIRSQEVLTRKNMYNVLEMRVTNQERAQHSTLQKIPQMRMMQQSAFLLVEKVRSAIDFSLPEWKNTFAVLLFAEDQKTTAGFLNEIDNMNNSLTKLTADVLHTATIEVVKSSQRAVLDFETLKHVHDKFLSTIDEVKAIVDAGRVEREQVTRDLAALKDDMVAKIGAH